jgi:hypothetical protein
MPHFQLGGDAASRKLSTRKLKKGTFASVHNATLCFYGAAADHAADQTADALADRVRGDLAQRRAHRSAEKPASGLPDASVDGVVVAAAIHWFAGDDFNREVRRVCRPG